MTSLKKRILRGDRLTGGWLSLSSPIAAQIMAEAGYDVLMIDLEHTASNYLSAISLMQAVQAGGGTPVIRCSSADMVDIKRTLDAGPAGIMVPNILDAAHAREVVAHCRYAPEGDRGAAPGYIRATAYYGDRVPDYLRAMREDFLLIIQVESAGAVSDIDAIAATDGVDMVFIGPADLSASLGRVGDFSSAAFTEAFARIESRTLAAGTALGCITFADWTAGRLYANGHQLVLAGADAMLLAAAAAGDRQELSAALEQQA